MLEIFSRSEFFEVGPSGEKILRCLYIPAGQSLTVRALSQVVIALGSVLTFILKRRDLKGFRPDVVIGTVPALPTAVVAMVGAKSLNSPYVIDLRDAWPDLLSEVDK